MEKFGLAQKEQDVGLSDKIFVFNIDFESDKFGLTAIIICMGDLIV